MENNLSTTSSKEDAGANTVSNLLDQEPLSEGSLRSDLNDTGASTIVVRSPTIAERTLNGCYPIQTAALSSLDRTDFRNMQLAGLGLGVSKDVQRKFLVPIACIHSRPKYGDWCTNSTATMDEIKPCTGLTLNRSGRIETANIDHLNQRDPLAKESDAIHEAHYVCLECAQKPASVQMDCEIIASGRTALCRKHTRENTPFAHHGPCRCLESLLTGWRCWNCRCDMRSKLIDMMSDRYSQDMFVCSIKGCQGLVNQLPDYKGGNGELEWCWGCQMIISPSTGVFKW